MEPRYCISYKTACAPSQDLDQTAHPRNLKRVSVRPRNLIRVSARPRNLIRVSARPRNLIIVSAHPRNLIRASVRPLNLISVFGGHSVGSHIPGTSSVGNRKLNALVYNNKHVRVRTATAKMYLQTFTPSEESDSLCTYANWSESSLGAHAVLYEMLCPSLMMRNGILS